MLNAIVASALLGLTASAAPQNWGHGWGGSWNGGSPSYAAPTSTASATGAGQTPFTFPLSNGFPANVSAAALTSIERQAHGTLPNGPLPSAISDTSAATLSLIAFNEIFEVAFFTSLIQNITNNVAGYEIGSGAVRQVVLNALIAIQAQEELHALGANGILAAAGRPTISACKYVFPTSDFDGAIALAATFTDVVLGTLQDALNNFATDGDSEFVPLIGSVIGQEGEQDGFFRNLENKIPSQLPFLTRSAAPFAFSALNQLFVVPGSCSAADFKQIPLPILGALSVSPLASGVHKSQTLMFKVKEMGAALVASEISVVYINQQNLPVTEAVSGLQTASDGTTTFNAYFPFDEYLLEGLTIAAVVKGTGNFTSADAVASATLFGPGLIEID